MKVSTERRLFQYAWLFKKSIMIAIICLIIATAMELAGPLIAKKVIDDHILGIEGIWYEVDDGDDRAAYDGKFFVRKENANQEEVKGKPWTLIAIGRSYYITDSEVPFEGKRAYEDGQLMIGSDGETRVAATKLSVQEVYQFFVLEKKAIIILLAIYIGLLFAAGIFQFFQTYLLQNLQIILFER